MPPLLGKVPRSDGADEEAAIRSAATRGPVRRLSQRERMEAYARIAVGADAPPPTGALTQRAHAGLGACLRCVAPAFAAGARCAGAGAMLASRLWTHAAAAADTTPACALRIVFGAALCVFGGDYVAALSAIEAFRQFGGRAMLDEVRLLWPDEPAMRAVREPKRLGRALALLWSAYLAVLAALRLDLARVVALALGLAELVKFPLLRLMAPVLVAAPGELRHWSEPFLDGALALGCVAAGLYLRNVLAAVYASLRGGQLVAEAAFSLLHARGWLRAAVGKSGDASYDPNASNADELLGYALGAGGLVAQLGYSLELPFGADAVLLLPLVALEWLLGTQVSLTAAAVHMHG